MATVSVKIPDGKYCLDEQHLSCFYAEHCQGTHYCHLYRHYLGNVEYMNVNGDHITTINKCKPCLNALNGDVGPLAITVDTEDVIDDKN